MKKRFTVLVVCSVLSAAALIVFQEESQLPFLSFSEYLNEFKKFSWTTPAEELTSTDPGINVPRTETTPQRHTNEIENVNSSKDTLLSSEVPKTGLSTVGDCFPFSLCFHHSRKIPYFYNITYSHRNDKFRGKPVVTIPYSSKPLRQDFTKSKMILFHNRPRFVHKPLCQKGIQMCPIRTCMCSYDPRDLTEADAVIIDGVDLRLASPPNKSSNQVWIFFGLESPVHYHTYYHRSEKYRKIFNWTMTYRLDSDIPVPYGILVQHNEPSGKNYTEITSRKAKSAAWLVSNCNTISKREDYVRELRKYYNVDIYGRCGKPCRSKTCFKELGRDYRFYLAFENSLCDDYISEKLFKTFSRDIDLVSVVRGGANYTSMIPAGSYINTASFSSPKRLAEYLQYLERNVTAYTEILRKKDGYIAKRLNDTISYGFCNICMKIHNLDVFSNMYFDNVKWLGQGTCHSPKENK